MICSICKQEVSSEARFCPYCDSSLADEAAVEEAASALEMLLMVTRQLEDEICAAFGENALVGDCPECGSSETGRYENVFQEDASLGRCFECDQVWCLDCGELIEESEASFHECAHGTDI